MNTNKGSIVKPSGNDVEGCRSEKVLVQPNMRVFLQYSVRVTDQCQDQPSTLQHLSDFLNMFYFLQFHGHSVIYDFVLMCLEVKSDYQKSSWLKSLFYETNLGFWGLSRDPGACSSRKFRKWSLSDWLKMHFLPIVNKLKEFSSVILNYAGKEGLYRSIIRISHIFNHTISRKRKFVIKTKIKA